MAEQAEEQGKAEFLPLWPTLFMSVILPGHESANGVLSTIVMQDNAEQEQMTTNYLSRIFLRQTIRLLAGWCNAVSMVWQNMCGLAGWGLCPNLACRHGQM